MFKVPNKYRVKTGNLGSNDSIGNAGAFAIPFEGGATAIVIASDGLGWEHVSVHMEKGGKQYTPSWSIMCTIKDLFWEPTDFALQYHPPHSDYVNIHNHTLHLWRPIFKDVPMPPKIMV